MKGLSIAKVLVLVMFLSVLVVPFQGYAQEKVITLKVANWFPICPQAVHSSGKLGQRSGEKDKRQGQGELLPGRSHWSLQSKVMMLSPRVFRM